MEYFLAHLGQSFIVLGLILLAVEVLVLGFSTFVLFFIGVGAIATGALMALGVIPETFLNSLLVTAIISTVVALISWKPMKKMQNKVESKHVNNDMIGHQFVLTEELLVGKTVTHRYSGISWQVKAKQPLSAGTEVKIIEVEVGLLTVARVE
ncbi:activity regulator of membrane protease YbbK [Psychromonas sp. MB-3u-54]|uniref:NfeD family protein n=1 Tax=Psychromonas sp. MB-3u-54 TaxID=2058319 RepID=UPI000C33139E|nr:NfeD family protein [Psychromonas sp. MB-3u-54]PKH03293.1 activity regulator of membrane protease YbbK [Psychromonas sp. MB-3u-54]